jgi:hypothetical protein
MTFTLVTRMITRFKYNFGCQEEFTSCFSILEITSIILRCMAVVGVNVFHSRTERCIFRHNSQSHDDLLNFSLGVSGTVQVFIVNIYIYIYIYIIHSSINEFIYGIVDAELKCN